MVIRPLTRPLLAALLALVVPLVACNKKKEQPAQNNGQPGLPGVQINTGPGTGFMAAPESDVARYPDEGPEAGTVVTKKVVIARKAADQGSEILTRMGPGTAINKRARKGPYYLVEFPAAPGQMRLGWVLQDDINTPAPVATPTVTTAPPATTTAPAVNGRPRPIVLPGRK